MWIVDYIICWQWMIVVLEDCCTAYCIVGSKLTIGIAKLYTRNITRPKYITLTAHVLLQSKRMINAENPTSFYKCSKAGNKNSISKGKKAAILQRFHSHVFFLSHKYSYYSANKFNFLPSPSNFVCVT